MTRPWRIALWSVPVVVVCFGVAAWIAPHLEAGRMREPLRLELARALGRNVEFGEVRYQLIPMPGMSAENVVISEDPAFGLEPLAYVQEMQVGVRWSSVLMGHLEIDSVRLVGASVNMARHDQEGWNVGRLLQGMVAGVRRGGQAPRLVMSGGRINFRNGITKSPFFLNDVDLDLAPPATAQSGIEWNMEASPARTDRAEQGFGHFTGQGRWRPVSGQSREGQIELETELEPSVLSEVMVLLTGRDLGLQGRVSSRARLDGPLNDIKIRGQIELVDLDSSTLFGLNSHRWQLPYEGTLDLVSQRVDFSTAKSESAALPLTIHIAAESVLSQPKLNASFAFDAMPAGTLLDLARRVGMRVPADLSVDGRVDGSLSLNPEGHMEGAIQLKDASARLGPAGPVRIAEAPLRFDGSTVELTESSVQTPSGSVATLAGVWSAEGSSLSFDLGFKNFPEEELRTAADALPGAAAPPLLDACRNASMTGSLRYKTEEGSTVSPWSGTIDIADARCQVNGLSEPLVVTRAGLAIQGDDWTVRHLVGRAGTLPLEATIRAQGQARRPLVLSVSFAKASGAELEHLLRPALLRRVGFLERTLPFRRSAAPTWLTSRHAEGDLRVADFTVAGEAMRDLRMHFYWDGLHLECPQFSVREDAASFDGRLQVRLGADRPSYHIVGRLQNYPWQDGESDAEIDLHTSGMGAELKTNLRAEGSFFLRNVQISDDPWRSMSGSFDYNAQRDTGKLRLREIEATAGVETFYGSGNSTADGALSLDLTSPRRGLRLAGTLNPLQLSQPDTAHR